MEHPGNLRQLSVDRLGHPRSSHHLHKGPRFARRGRPPGVGRQAGLVRAARRHVRETGLRPAAPCRSGPGQARCHGRVCRIRNRPLSRAPCRAGAGDHCPGAACSAAAASEPLRIPECRTWSAAGRSRNGKVQWPPAVGVPGPWCRIMPPPPPPWMVSRGSWRRLEPTFSASRAAARRAVHRGLRHLPRRTASGRISHPPVRK